MKRLFSAKSLVVAAVALGAVGAASVAQAGTDVTFSIGVNAPYGYVRPAPVYVQPQPVYVQPRPVYVQPRPVYVQPQTIYHGNEYRWDRRRWDRRGPHGDRDRDGIPNRFDRDSRHFDPRVAYRQGGWGDRDRDGVPNRFDSAPFDPYRH